MDKDDFNNQKLSD